MSTHIEWIPENQRGHIVDEDRSLKYALKEEYGGRVDEVMTTDDIPFLRGLRAAKVLGADKLIAAIEKHDRIRVYETE